MTSQQHELEEELITKTNLLLNEDSIDLEEDDSNANMEYSITLLANIVSFKRMNVNTVQSILSKAWHPSKGMKIRNLEENLFCINFNHEWDRKRILDSRPWSISGSHMVVRDWPPDLTLKEIDFNLSPFWVRICGLPPNQMTKLNAEKIAKKVGVLKEIDFTENGKISWLKFLWLRVEIDIRKPLFTGFNRSKDPLRMSWVQLQFERLPDFCFNCGRLGHVGRSCQDPPLVSPSALASPYGPWLRSDFISPIPTEACWNPLLINPDN
ncbi:hypothetical protein RJ639_029684 [Escallonia herrerae]|uniref:CCHC-type domain-containing protein n=1 Tax=Escallonia herrerae TaxID=1293975 RepID=A0AA88WZR7_9ASTE|nr:hypothetical protein RJ639_029684 [Escallonia herrerae]